MLISSERLINTPVMSLQTGGQLARTKAPLIDPRNLMIVAYELEGPALDIQPSFLLIDDVRELSNMGLIIDSSDEFIGIDDVIRIHEIYNFRFILEGKTVRDENRHKLGKVTGYSIEPGSFMIKQLNVRRPLLKSLTDTEIIVDRTQVTEVNDSEIIIKHDERQPAPVQHTNKAFSNPFRGTTPQPEAIDTKQR